MKKLLICCAVMFSAVFVAAEDMKFVTLLSQPVGSFSRVELLDQATPADIFHLNFCNTDASGGTITVDSSLTTPVDVEKLQVNSSATLGGNVKILSADRITVYDNPGFEGGTLAVQLAGPAKILVDDKSSKTAEFVHDDAVSIKTADFKTLNIADTAVLDTPATRTTLTSNLGWKKVAAISDKTTANAYILTDWNGSLTVDKEEDDDSCVVKDCGDFGTWDPVTCSCKLNTTTTILPGGSNNRYCTAVQCPDGYIKNENCQCICARVCPVTTTLNVSTCTCVPKGGSFITPGNDRIPVGGGNIVIKN